MNTLSLESRGLLTRRGRLFLLEKGTTTTTTITTCTAAVFEETRSVHVCMLYGFLLSGFQFHIIQSLCAEKRPRIDISHLRRPCIREGKRKVMCTPVSVYSEVGSEVYILDCSSEGNNTCISMSEKRQERLILRREGKLRLGRWYETEETA